MDFDEYVVARRRLLVERAVTLGADASEAEAIVDAVLARQRPRIARAADPDEQVHTALELAVRGPSPHRRSALLAAAALAVALAGAGLVWWVTRPPEQVRVPSLFAADAPGAALALDRLGLRTELVTAPGCEPRGLVLSLVPAGGSLVDVGSTVQVTVAVEREDSCRDALDRRDAWAFLAFTRGAPPPAFADTVYVVEDAGEPAVLPGGAAADPGRWAAIQDVADAVASLDGHALKVSALVPPAEHCGVPRPSAAGDRAVLRLELPREDGAPCGVTVDLYRSGEGVIDAVVVYSGR